MTGRSPDSRQEVIKWAFGTSLDIESAPARLVNIEQRCARVMWQHIPCEFLCPGLSCAASSVSACCWRLSEGEIAVAGTAEAVRLPGAR
jgi:hypothetical protein